MEKDGVYKMTKYTHKIKQITENDECQVYDEQDPTYNFSLNISECKKFKNFLISNNLIKNEHIIIHNKLIKNDLILDQGDYEYYTKLKKFDFSGSNSEGEGEMKIFDLIHDIKTNEPILFFSPDSDVILLSMISKNAKYIQVLKYDINDNLLKLSLVTLEFSSRMLTCYFICLLGKEAFKMVDLPSESNSVNPRLEIRPIDTIAHQINSLSGLANYFRARR